MEGRDVGVAEFTLCLAKQLLNLLILLYSTLSILRAAEVTHPISDPPLPLVESHSEVDLQKRPIVVEGCQGFAQGFLIFEEITAPLQFLLAPLEQLHNLPQMLLL